MVIDRIKISGFTNIGETSLSFSNLCALIAPNNYGKTNVLTAIRFAIDFITNHPKGKQSQMKYRPAIPINVHLAGLPFSCELEGKIEKGSENPCHFIYGYSFDWEKTNGAGAAITTEYLKFKEINDSKYKSYIERDNSEDAKYLASPTGRCSKKLPLTKDTLAINKLSNFDDLFYISWIKAINNLEIQFANTLENPEQYFSLITPDDDVNDYSVDFPHSGKIGFFISSLEKTHPNKYEILKNTIMDLLPSVEDFSPVQVDLRKESPHDEKLPFRLPDVFYDIKIKEKYNNQYTSIERVSTGCKKILYVLTLAIAADLNNIPLLLFEELENSVHPRLLQSLLVALSQVSGNTRILTTSHSPYLIKYLRPEQIKLGMPSDKGISEFKALKPSKVNKVMRLASSEEVSLGEYLFEMMLDLETNEELLNEYFS